MKLVVPSSGSTHQIKEFTGPVENVAKLFKEPIVPENGKIILSDKPGLGLEYDEEELNKVIKI